MANFAELVGLFGPWLNLIEKRAIGMQVPSWMFQINEENGKVRTRKKGDALRVLSLCFQPPQSPQPLTCVTKALQNPKTKKGCISATLTITCSPFRT